MIPIKINGLIIRIISFFVLFFLISCVASKSKLAERNYFNKNYFYNDSLKVAIDFEDDLEFSDVSFLKTKEYKQFLNLHKQLVFKDLFLAVKSIKNEYELSLFTNKLKDFKDTLISQKIVFKDSINNTIIFEKQKGLNKIIGFLKNKSKNNISDFSLQLASKINMDSVEKWQFSSKSIFENYFENTHPNDLLARKKFDKQPFKNYRKDEWRFDIVAAVNSFISNNIKYDSIIKIYEKVIKEKYNPFISNIAGKVTTYKNNSVFDKIAEIAKNNQVIMLNENHFYPNNRIFSMQMLSVLKQNGFTHISLEAFDPPVDSKMQYSPKYEDGQYTSEPYYAHFLRKAKELGLVIQGHESYGGCEGRDSREIGQAKNIYKILKEKPAAKIFVYVGFGHIEKDTVIGDKRKKMAFYFKKLSGINPITINQTLLHTDNKEDLLLIARTIINDSIKNESSADYFLVNNIKPNLKLIYPNAVFVKSKIQSKKFKNYRKKEVLVEIINFVEYHLLNKSAVPISSFLATPKNKEIDFELPIGKYHVYVKTTDNTIIYDDNLIVN
ncbi:hypothetical protein [Flavobacterium gawalongense]|uniref:Uncharacterized protein n=1 Tax=Flavobacterium gawalongense TaxID=2594432 RepID=A0A553BX53_9FLAO|nr:hypothetical protein [Flavobacterium gawalongense]TRX04265.1 hypothetical protein FNW33_01945 [Flavobacterium gawalongense]TRX09286.1 hypothetical protein FNW12_02325 [Flavobacterium gawalongense]TRX12901.1 hypothetical protein FNW11_02455 [Flavobacterium gawalongense]TRX13245.1 hypothetical protein FNW10_02450 [Flavobacterium gawalongense]TRX30693.1 hypothetical protein FNW38_02800 [Flavobacterium gawalongense]